MKSEYEHGERFDYTEDEGRVGHAAVGFDFDSVIRSVDGECSDAECDARDAARLAVYKTLEFLLGPTVKTYRPNVIALRVLSLARQLGVVEMTQGQIAERSGVTRARVSQEKARIRGIVRGRQIKQAVN